MAKQVIYGDQARAKMKAGIEKVANAVKVTLGPKGRSVAADHQRRRDHRQRDRAGRPV